MKCTWSLNAPQQVAGRSLSRIQMLAKWKLPENVGLVDLFGQANTKTIQAKDLAYYHREDRRTFNFFKAKKLSVLGDKLDRFISDLVLQQEYRHRWASDFFDYEFHQDGGASSPTSYRHYQLSLLNMLQANELNPNTALLYYEWMDANLDDIEKCFLTYGGDA